MEMIFLVLVLSPILLELTYELLAVSTRSCIERSLSISGRTYHTNTLFCVLLMMFSAGPGPSDIAVRQAVRKGPGVSRSGVANLAPSLADVDSNSCTVEVRDALKM